MARITDPLAAADQLTAVFHEHGLDIRVKALPVSPSLVGTIVFSDIDVIRSLHAGRCLTGGGTSCPVGLVIPADFAGEGNVVVGRAARSGETYGSSADAFGNGEALHCSGILGRPAADAIPILRKKGLTPQWMTGGQRTGPNPPDGYVVGGVPLSSTAVLLDTVPEPLATPEFRHYEALANRGC